MNLPDRFFVCFCNVQKNSRRLMEKLGIISHQGIGNTRMVRDHAGLLLEGSGKRVGKMNLSIIARS